MPHRKNPLQKQLDQQKFLHVIDYVRKEALGPKTLTSAELGRLNQFLCGHNHDENFDPWRVDQAQVTIPSGQVHHFNVLTNSHSRARELIGQALQMVGNKKGFEAFFFIYTQMVLAHFFKQANRRTAVAAGVWILLLSDLDCDAERVLNLRVGDLRQPAEVEKLRQLLSAEVKPRA